MSNPSFENIDQWLFEHMEGNLSPTQVSQLEMFLLNNPEFEPDLDAWQLAKVDATPVEYPGVAGRKRRPIPFWISATAVLTTVFIAGGLFGAYVTSSNSDKKIDLVANSVANRIDHQLIANNDASPFLNGNRDFDNNETENAENLYSTSTSSNRNAVDKVNAANSFSTTNQTHDRTNGVKSNKSLNSKTDFSVEDLISIATPNHQTEIETSEFNSVPKSRSDVIKERKAKENGPTNNDIASKAEKNSSSKDDNKATKAKNGTDPSVTADAMTRGSGQRISSNHSTSFAKKMKSTMRKIARMTDNPIALTNSKDIYYHVPGMQTLNVNAATAGNLLRPRIQSISRAQWTGHSNQQLLNELSFDTYVRSIRGGIGVQLNHAYYNDGTYNVGQVALTYSPKFTVNRNFSIEPAIRLKMGDKRLNALNLVPGQIIEMERGNEKIFYNETPENVVKDLWYKDVALALNSNTKWFSIGFQVDNLGRHNNNVYNSTGQNDRAGMHYTANLGTDFVSRSKIISLSPYIMYQKVENLSEIWGGSIFRYKNLTVGGAYSSTGDYAGSIGLKTDRFMLTYNADMTKSVLNDKRLFSQQVTMRILMNKGRYGRTMLKQ